MVMEASLLSLRRFPRLI